MWFTYDPEDGLEEFASRDEAILAAKMKIDTYRDGTEWVDGVERIMVFEKVCGVRDTSPVSEYEQWKIEWPPMTCEESCDGETLVEVVNKEVTRAYSAPEEDKPLMPPWAEQDS